LRVIITEPSTGILNGIHLNQWRVGQTYDLPSSLASFLILQGVARMEMRFEHSDRRRAARPDASDRRAQAARR
jgi:hypothetical protein